MRRDSSSLTNCLKTHVSGAATTRHMQCRACQRLRGTRPALARWRLAAHALDGNSCRALWYRRIALADAGARAPECRRQQSADYRARLDRLGGTAVSTLSPGVTAVGHQPVTHVDRAAEETTAKCSGQPNRHCRQVPAPQCCYGRLRSMIRPAGACSWRPRRATAGPLPFVRRCACEPSAAALRIELQSNGQARVSIS